MIIAIFILLIVIFAIVTAIDARNFTHTKNHQRKVNNSIDFGMEYLNNCFLSSGRVICCKNIKKGITYGSELYSPITQSCMIYSLLLLEKMLGIDDLKEKLQYACDNPDAVKKLKDGAADFICGKYNWDDVVEQTLKLYQS